MIKKIIRNYLINVFALWFVTWLIPSISFSDGFKSLLLVSLGFTFIHMFIRPVVQIITGPLNFISFGIVGLLVDGGLFYLLTYLFPQLVIKSWSFPGLVFLGIIVPSVLLEPLAVAVVAAILVNVIRSTISSLCE